MRLLLPEPVDPVDPVEVYSDLPVVAGRPGVRLNMVASADGATAIDGRAGGLAAESDRRLFRVMRSLADVILVGGRTMRAERYRPTAVPIAVVSRTCDFDWSSPFFADATCRPIIFTVAHASGDRRLRAVAVADVVIAGEVNVDLAMAVAELGRRGYRHVLAEGGPTLNPNLIDAGILDELCLSVSPMLVGGDARRVLNGGLLDPPRTLELRSLCEEDGNLFCRYRLGGAPKSA